MCTSVYSAESMKRSGVRLSVCLPVPSFAHRTRLRRVCCWAPWRREISIDRARRTAANCTALSNNCEQCHADSWCRKLNTDLFKIRANSQLMSAIKRVFINKTVTTNGNFYNSKNELSVIRKFTFPYFRSIFRQFNFFLCSKDRYFYISEAENCRIFS